MKTFNDGESIVRYEYEVVSKDMGKVYRYEERDEELNEPIPEKPRFIGIYHVVYRSLWDMIRGRSIEDVLMMDIERCVQEERARKLEKENRKSFTYII